MVDLKKTAIPNNSSESIFITGPSGSGSSKILPVSLIKKNVASNLITVIKDEDDPELTRRMYEYCAKTLR